MEKKITMHVQGVHDSADFALQTLVTEDVSPNHNYRLLGFRQRIVSESPTRLIYSVDYATADKAFAGSVLELMRNAHPSVETSYEESVL